MKSCKFLIEMLGEIVEQEKGHIERYKKEAADYKEKGDMTLFGMFHGREDEASYLVKRIEGAVKAFEEYKSYFPTDATNQLTDEQKEELFELLDKDLHDTTYSELEDEVIELESKVDELQDRLEDRDYLRMSIHLKDGEDLTEEQAIDYLEGGIDNV